MFIVRGAGQCVPRCGCYDFWRRLSTREGAAGRLIVSSAAFCRLFPCSLSYMLACLSSFGTRRFCVPKLLTVDCCTVVKKKCCFHLLHLLPPSPTFSNLLPPSPTFSSLLQPSPTFSHLLQPSPTFPTDFWSQGCRSQGALGDCQLCQGAVSPRREPGAKEP